MKTDREVFGYNSKGEQIDIFTITNDNGMIIKVIELGATLHSVIVPDRNGEFKDVLLGYDDVDTYEHNNDDNLGVIIGRNANRISDAKFTLNGVEYELEKNNGDNNLHSGSYGFSRRKWTSSQAVDERGMGIEFTLLSPDGDQGMPGSLTASVKYILTNSNEIIIEYTGVSDKDTIVNMTNHGYYNLAGHDSGDMYDQLLCIRAEKYTPSGSDLIPTGELAAVEGTPMDFTKPKPIGQDINSGFEQLVMANGYDHNYVLDEVCEGEYNARLYDEKSGRCMDIFTNFPGIQIYTGNFLSGIKGKGGCPYYKGDGVALETQHFPNAVNIPSFPSPVVKAGEKFYYMAKFAFSVK